MRIRHEVVFNRYKGRNEVIGSIHTHSYSLKIESQANLEKSISQGKRALAL